MVKGFQQNYAKAGVSMKWDTCFHSHKTITGFFFASMFVSCLSISLFISKFLFIHI